MGILVGAFAFASLIARLPVGAAYTLERASKLLLFGGGVSVAAFILVPFVTHPLLFGGLMALDGIGWALATTTQLAVLVAARPRGLETAEAMGWYSGATGLGHTIAGGLGGGLADLLGFRASFFILAALTASGALVLYGAVERARRASRSAQPAEAEVRVKPKTPKFHALRGLSPLVWAGTSVMVYINLLNGVVGTFHPIMALGAGLTLTQIGILSSCRSWASSSIRLGSGPIFARIPAAKMTSPLMIIGALSVISIPLLRSSFLLQVPLFLMTGLARGLLRVTGSSEAFDAAEDSEDHHGMIAALLHAGLDLGKVGGPVLGGLVAQFAGIGPMFVIVPTALVVVYASLLMWVRRGSDPAALDRLAA